MITLEEKNINIDLVKGDTLSFGVEFEGLDQSLSSAEFTCKKSYDGPTLFKKTIGSGITMASSSPYQYIVRLAPEDTKLLAAGTYRYDFKIYINSDRFTLMRGALNLLQAT